MSVQDEHFSAAHIEEKAESLVHRVEEGAVHVLHRLPLGKARAPLPLASSRCRTPNVQRHLRVMQVGPSLGSQQEI